MYARRFFLYVFLLLVQAAMPLAQAAGQGRPRLSQSAAGDGALCVAVAPEDHVTYGFAYPLTHILLIPSGSNGLTAYRRYSVRDPWTPLVEKHAGDLFDGIDAVRFDYGHARAYVSIAFPSTSDSVFVRITDAGGAAIASSHEGLAKYYDNRAAAVVVTADDWWVYTDSAFVQAIDQWRSRGLWVTAGVITGLDRCNDSTWTSIQNQLDSGYVEVASHSRSHIPTPYPSVVSEVVGSCQDLKDRLVLPPAFRNGDREYVYTWISPYGSYDSDIDKQVTKAGYLVPRLTNRNFSSFSDWQTTGNKFGPSGVAYEVGPDPNRGVTNLATLNSTFDGIVGQGGIYVLYTHPKVLSDSGEWSKPYLPSHMDYISRRPDVWYTSLGHLYLYHLPEMMLVPEIVPVNVVVNGNFEAGVAPWTRYSNGGSGNTFSVVAATSGAEGVWMGRVTLGATIGTNNQLYQKGIRLESGGVYRMQYRVSASRSTSIRVRVIEQDDDYTVYGFPFVTHSVTTGWKTNTVDFTAGNFAGTVSDAMLQFYFVSSTPSTTIYLDDIRIGPREPVGLPTRVRFAVQPATAQPGAVVTPPITVRIEDDQGVLMTGENRLVSLALGSDPPGATLGGTTSVYSVGGIATFADLTVDRAGSGYTLHATSAGLQSAVSDLFNVTAPEEPPPPTVENRVFNGNFEAGVVPWTRYSNGGSGNTFSVVAATSGAEGLWMGRVTLGATIGTNNQLYQKGIRLDSGGVYRMQYRVSASRSTSIRVRVIEQDDDYTVYGFPFVTHSVTTGWKTNTVDFTAGNFAGTVSDAMAQFYFVSSTPSTTIYLDDVRIVASSGGGGPLGKGSDDAAMGRPNLEDGRPMVFGLSQNYPNPFNPTTIIKYQVPAQDGFDGPVASDVWLAVYDMLGREVAVLVDEKKPAGKYEVEFDGTRLSTGMYLYRFTAGTFIDCRRMMLIK